MPSPPPHPKILIADLILETGSYYVALGDLGLTM